jgi:hypothetical protein
LVFAIQEARPSAGAVMGHIKYSDRITWRRRFPRTDPRYSFKRMSPFAHTLSALDLGLDKLSNGNVVNSFIYTMIAGTIFGAVGLGAFGYGKKMSLWQPRVIGAGLMLVPFVIYNLWLLCGLCSGLLVLLWFYHDE